MYMYNLQGLKRHTNIETETFFVAICISLYKGYELKVIWHTHLKTLYK